MNPERRQSPRTPFSSLHEDDGLITPWKEIKRGVQRLTGLITPDQDEEPAKPADRRSYQHTEHLQVDPLPIHSYEENARPAPPRPFAPIDAAESFAAPPSAPSINRIYTGADLCGDRAERITPDSGHTAALNPSDDRRISTDFPSEPSPRPSAPFHFGGDDRDELRDDVARTIRADEREVDFGHDPSIDLRSGFDGDAAARFPSEHSPRSSAPFQFGGDDRDELRDDVARTIRADGREVDFGHDPSIDLRSGFDADAPTSFPSEPSPRPSTPFYFSGDERSELTDDVAQPRQSDEDDQEFEHHPSIDPRRWDDEQGMPPQSFASSFDPSDWSDEIRRDPEPASSDDPAPDDEAFDAPEPWLHVDPLRTEPPATPRERGGLRNPKWRPEPGPNPSDDVPSSPHQDAFEPSGDGMTPPAASPSDVAEPGLDQPYDAESKIDTPPSTKPAPAVDDAGHIFSPLDLRDRVVIMLLFKQVVSVEQVQETWVAWRREQRAGSKEMLWRAVARRNDVDREAVYAEAAEVYAFETHQLNVDEALKVIDGLQSARKFTETDWQTMRDLGVLPIKVQQVDGQPRYVFGAYDPSATQVQQFAKHLKIGIVELVYVPESTIKALVIDAFAPRNEYLERISDDNLAFDLGLSHDQEGLVDEDALDAEINRSTLINLFEATLVEAVRQGASDIHIFPNAQNRIEIHMRLNGELNCWHVEERVHPEAFLAVVKDNAINIDRFERDMGQDGFLQRKIDNTLIRFRVSVMPLMSANHELRAESIVLRVLDDRKVVTDFRKLGFQELALRQFTEAISKPHGMVILTGPTGSGKTTTLYAALHQVVTPKKNVLTVEDPVEYVLPGVRQLKLTHKFGLEEALRSILRHDPDIVMVGEMRDRPTAELAIKLANTGHLTFSTLHTNDAPSAVSRLYKMGIEPFLIAYAVNLVAAQRLVRKLCPDCRRPQTGLDPEYLAYLGFDPHEQTTFYAPGETTSCKRCKGTGYTGRRAVTETMPFTREIRQIIIDAKGDIDEDALRDAAIRGGMLTLRDSAREFVRMGETSIEEMHRATVSDG